MKRFLNWLLKILGLTTSSNNEKRLDSTLQPDIELPSEPKEIIYESRPFMTRTELKFYNTLKDLENYYKIVPQINLATIIRKKDSKFINELFRNIDFAIFTKDYSKLLLLIELNDPSHNQISRKQRDLKVKKICNDTNIKLMTFHTEYPNEKPYVLNRILKEINKDS